MWNNDKLTRIGEQIVGFGRFVDWCGGWPSFHDAQILRLDLNRKGQSRLVVHVLGGSRPTFGPRANTHFSVPPEDVDVTFILDGIEGLELAGFSHQNVIFDLFVEQNEDMLRITLEPCFGLAGTIDVRRIEIRFESSNSHEHR